MCWKGDDACFRAIPGSWLPLFDEYRLTAGLESHDHALKRTYPLRAGELAAAGAGTLYLGGGCWGKSNVEVPNRGLWYLAETLRRRHFWRITLDGAEARYTALGAAGQVFDELTQRVGDAAS